MKLPYKDPNSHKGQKGKVIVIGGSAKYYGAPILTALGAEKAGADLINVYLPSEHMNTAKNYSLNLFLNPFHQENLSNHDVDKIIENANSCDAVVIGNGLDTNAETKLAIIEILKLVKTNIVIDAEAIVPEILSINSNGKWVLTPHQAEFKRLYGNDFTPVFAKEMAQKYNHTLCIKGKLDYVISEKSLYENHTGCPEMRVGGTGDVLAGIIASYIAQGLEPLEACRSAIYYYGNAGIELNLKKNNFTAYDLIKFYPKYLASIKHKF
ncbi:hypothetical protein RFI_19849 [Reticulomyxa filosa]|uniref:ATP-dependent (S)-NAD(P)H-hydrate dehydratase n=1 Tax=Reticulomyxa filosa TaxID=46433 RepID=X6MWL4_RETFI|nr:hypothetical protein RFI_19849 [Reticulomyxa filosa]|eukprot:ETO17475.1 hypothetical protein RFI_19849 [Reticulomyxa filosa]